MNKDIVFSISRDDALDIVVHRANGDCTFIVRQRWNPVLHSFLKNGKSFDEMRAVKTHRSKASDQLVHSLRHIRSVAAHTLCDIA